MHNIVCITRYMLIILLEQTNKFAIDICFPIGYANVSIKIYNSIYNVFINIEYLYK
jgi:hypothetical protein